MIPQYTGKIKDICLFIFLNFLCENLVYAQCEEKVYVHSDRNDYIPGDTIWLRDYLIGNVGSGIIYTELTDNNKQMVCRTILYSDSNLFEGFLVLPDSMANGTYLLRAYTNYLRNFGEEAFFLKEINVGEGKQIDEKVLPWDYSCGFFPEGGKLCEGVLSRVAFKAVAIDGYGTEVKGTLFDRRGNKITDLKSLHRGMGSFSFMPQRGMNYYVEMESNGLAKRFELPLVEKGFSFMCYELRDSIHVIVKGSDEVKNQQFYVTASVNDSIVYTDSARLVRNGYRIIMPANYFPEGIVCFTLFNEMKIQEGERLMYISGADNLNISLIPNQPDYTADDVVSLDIEVTDSNGQPVEGSFSLSVTESGEIVEQTKSFNIYAYHFLSSNLKGFIEDPGWYFADSTPERKTALDILLCTQGWRRFVNNRLFDVEKDFEVTGKVYDAFENPAKDISVTLFDLTNFNLLGECVTDQDGNFGFIGFDAQEGASFMLKAIPSKENELVRIQLQKKNLKAEINLVPRSRQSYSFNHDSLSVSLAKSGTSANYDRNGVRQIELGEITVMQKRKQPKNKLAGRYKLEGDLLQNLNFSEGMTYALKILPSPNGLPLEAQSSRSGAQFFIQRGVNLERSTWVEVTQIPVYQVESIEVIPAIKEKNSYGLSPRGKVIVTMKNSPGKPAESKNPGVALLNPDGYCVHREFYVPAYDVKDNNIHSHAAIRKTIYWNPSVTTNLTGTATVHFCPENRLSDYAVIIEGKGIDRGFGYATDMIKIKSPIQAGASSSNNVF